MSTTCYARLLGGVALVTLLSGCAGVTKQQPTQITAFKRLTYNRAANQVRLVAIKETARGIGAQAGLAWRSKKLNRMLGQQAMLLSRTFNFRIMLLPHHILPPILVQGVNTLQLDDTSTIRLADRVYKIERPARFVTAVPSWRDYLLTRYNPPSDPDPSMVPKTNQERNVWNEYVERGWFEGLQQAQDIYGQNLNRLRRDYQGMILYRKLLAQNIVTPPYVAQTNLGVTGNSKSIRVNDQILRIAAVSKLEPNSRRWNSRLSGSFKSRGARYRKGPFPAHLMK